MEFDLEQVSNFVNANSGSPFANRLAHVSELFIFHCTQWLACLDHPSQCVFFKGRAVENKPCQGALHHGTTAISFIKDVEEVHVKGAPTLIQPQPHTYLILNGMQ
jgi:hypothetical protein